MIGKLSFTSLCISFALGIAGASFRNPAAIYADYLMFLFPFLGILVFLIVLSSILNITKRYATRMGIFVFVSAIYVLGLFGFVQLTANKINWQHGFLFVVLFPPLIIFFILYLLPPLCLRAIRWQKIAFVIGTFPMAAIAFSLSNLALGMVMGPLIPTGPTVLAYFSFYSITSFVIQAVVAAYILAWNWTILVPTSTNPAGTSMPESNG